MVLLVGCAPLKQYRTDPAPCVDSTPEASCQQHYFQEYRDRSDPEGAYTLAFVEFDDQGQLHERDQMHDVIERVAETASTEDAIIAVFVHGWKHSAAPGDGSISMFRSSLKRLSRLESELGRTAGREPRSVIGIYLGWRGDSVTLPMVRELTFWERKHTAHIVGDGAVIDVLARLAQMREIKAAHADDATAETRLVVIGHSFGAAVVYSALNKVLAERFVYSRDEPAVSADIDGFGDLVVLVNPAFEAMRFTALSDMANERRTYFPGQLPVLAMLTSEADNATRTAFPLGRWFSTRFEKHRTMTRTNPVDGSEVTIHQRRANRTAVGHFTPYQTHRLGADNREDTAEPTDTEMFRRIAAGWENDGPGNIIRFRGSVLERSNDTVARNPYLVISVDPHLIPNHNDISDPAVVDFLAQLIQLSTQNRDITERHRIRSQMPQ